MTDITAEMIAPGHCNRPAQGRGRFASEVCEAREKLTWTPLSECGFEVELLRLLAKGRKSAVPALAALALLAAAVATNWISWKAALIWLVLELTTLGLAF